MVLWEVEAAEAALWQAAAAHAWTTMLLLQRGRRGWLPAAAIGVRWRQVQAAPPPVRRLLLLLLVVLVWSTLLVVVMAVAGLLLPPTLQGEGSAPERSRPGWW